ncbi:MAG TPA: tripartite tricarboxylate transporter substrate binding protein [Burkholderiales bacterium]|nr:tripartite tricarboxylate transporter substrate binding protein [Burkholderiales bacterium]
MRFVALALLLALSSLAHAQPWPSRPVRIVVPFPPGGGIDVAVRIVGERLTSALGQPVVIDNRAGAGGVIGTDAAAKAPGDGYTILASTPGPTSIAVNTNPKLAYDPVADFAPVSMLAVGANVVVVHPTSPARSMQELLALARARPGALNFGSSGVATSQHLSAELLKYMAKIDFVHVAYKGTGLALADLFAQRLDFMIADPSVLAHVKSGKVRALAVTTPKRYAGSPEIPTVAESGLPGFEAVNWYSLLVPAATPKVIIGRLNTEVVKILSQPDIRTKLLEQNIEAAYSTPDELARYLKKDIDKWAAVVKAAGIKPEGS